MKQHCWTLLAASGKGGSLSGPTVLGSRGLSQSHLHKFYFVFLGTHCFCLRTSKHAVYSVPSILVSFKGYIAGSQVLAGNTALLVWRFMTAPLPPPFWGRERKLFMWGRTMIRYQGSSSLFKKKKKQVFFNSFTFSCIWIIPTSQKPFSFKFPFS